MKVTKEQIMNRLSELVDQYIDEAEEHEDDSTLNAPFVEDRIEDLILYLVETRDHLVDKVCGGH